MAPEQIGGQPNAGKETLKYPSVTLPDYKEDLYKNDKFKFLSDVVDMFSLAGGDAYGNFVSPGFILLSSEDVEKGVTSGFPEYDEKQAQEIISKSKESKEPIVLANGFTYKLSEVPEEVMMRARFSLKQSIERKDNAGVVHTKL